MVPLRRATGGALAILLAIVVSGLPARPAHAAVLDQQVVRLQVGGLAGVPVDAAAVVLNVTGTEATTDGFVTAWPCDEPRPLASNLNLTPGLTTPNLVIARPSSTGRVCLYVQRGADLVVDLAGHLPAGAGYAPTASPTRLLDTRDGTGTTAGRLRAGDTAVVHAGGLTAPPWLPAAAVLNVTATEVGAPGYVTAWPCDEDRPLASNLNLTPGLTTPNLVIARPSATGDVCLFTTAPTQLVADAAGAVTDPATYRPASVPERVLDTRDGTGTAAGRLRPGDTVRLSVAGGPEAVALNVTAADVGAPGFVTVWPCDQPRPLASNLNLTAGLVTPNLVVARPSGSGEVCLFTSAATHLVADLQGTFPAGSPFVPAPNPVRLLDTRECLVSDAGPLDAAGATVCRAVHHAFPIAAGVPASYGRTHAAYTATDIFAACGSPVVSPVDGVVQQIRREDRYARPPDSPALRGGRSVAILGDDGIRYYGAHFESIEASLAVGARVAAGDPIARVGRSGDTSVCHVHFGLSFPCPGVEWEVRRGVVWPWPYLDAWRAGREASPVAELAALERAQPGRCAAAMALPTAADAG